MRAADRLGFTMVSTNDHLAFAVPWLDGPTALAAVIGRDNLAGTQFHPEKSQEAGLRLIRNFLRWRP